MTMRRDAVAERKVDRVDRSSDSNSLGESVELR